MAVDVDAREFGRHFKQGGWRLGLLVARNVQLSQGKRTDLSTGGQDAETPVKVSGAEFAQRAGVSKQNVAYYFRAWQLAADDGHCPHAENLEPNDDEALDHIEEDDQHARDLWLVYYRKARNDNREPQSGEHQNKASSGSNPKGAADNTAAKAVEALAKTSEQLSEKLVKVVSATPLSGEDAELAQFVDQLRHTRFVLDRHCRDIDRVLARIGHGDNSEDATASGFSVVPGPSAD